MGGRRRRRRDTKEILPLPPFIASSSFLSIWYTGGVRI